MQYTIQRWASQHIFSARTLLVFVHTVLGYIAYFTALNVADYLSIPWSLVFIPLLISILLLLNFYKKEAPKGIPYILIALRMLFWFFIGVQLSHFADEKESAISATHPSFIAYKAAPETTLKSIVPTVNKFLMGWKKLIQRDKKWVKIKSDNDGSIILIIIGAILLVLLIVFVGLSLSCSLSCNGAEAAALLVLVLTVLSVVGVIIGAIKMASRYSTKEINKEKEALRKRRQSQSGAKNPNDKTTLEEQQKEQDLPKSADEMEKEELRKRRQTPAPTAMPKKDVPPTSTQKIDVPPAPAPVPTPKAEIPKKKITPKERRYNKRLDKGIILAKILTILVLGGLIIFTILL
jgi:membrane protein implicated in regulation of membrane protease activity